MEERVTEFKCKHCNKRIAVKKGETLFFRGCVLQLRSCDLTITCECQAVFSFKYRQHRKNLLRERLNSVIT